MAFDPGAIDATLSAAVGDEPELIADLRDAFLDSATAGLATLTEANGAEAWRSAAWRLRGLAASFGATRLMTLAGEAGVATPHDPAILHKLARLIGRL